MWRPGEDWVLWEQDRALGRRVWARFADGRWHTRTEYDATALVEQNRRERNDTAGQRFGEWRKIASIPLNMAFDSVGQALKEGDRRFVKGFLNDGDNAAFRTFEGRA